MVGKNPSIRFKGYDDEWESQSLALTATINPHTVVPSIFQYVDLESVSGTSLQSFRTERKETAPSRAQRHAEFGDIFFQTVRPYQKNNFLFELNRTDFVFSTGYAQIRSNINSRFLFNVLQNDSFVNDVLINCTGSSYPAINPSTLGQIHISFPKNTDEQEKIGSLFTHMDNVISSKRQELEKLETVKKACMERMFPREGETTPQLRFKGFDGDWECRTLHECLDISKDHNTDETFGINDVLSVSEDFGVRNQIELLGRSYAGKSVSNYGILKHGQIVYTKSPLKSKPFGIVKYNDGHDGIVSVLYAVYIAKPGISARFIHYYFDPTWRINNYLRPLISKGAKNTMNISDEMALMGQIVIPKDIKEQEKIAFFFSHLDELIAAKRQEIEKLQNIKQSLLDKMFV